MSLEVEQTGDEPFICGREERRCLMIHGFTGGPFELEPLAERLRERGWKTVLPTLPGHEGTGPALHRVRASDWIRAAEQEAQRLAQHSSPFDLVGFSMGAFLAAYVANRYPVRKLVLLNAAVIFFSPGRLFRQTCHQIRQGDFRRIRSVKQTPVRATMEFVRLVYRLKGEFSRLSVPTLVIQGGDDPVVHPLSAKVLERNIPDCRQVVYFPRSGHLICLDRESGKVAETVEAFFMNSR